MAAGDGLVTMTPTSIAVAGAGSSASINADGGVDFTSATSLSLNGVFTSGFDNYVVVANLKTASGGILGNMRLRAGGTDNTASNYAYQFLDISQTNKLAARSTAQTETYWVLAGDRNSGIITHFYGPYLAQPTAIRTITSKNDSSAPGEMFETATTHSASTSFDGFTVYSAAVTGNIVVFGYEE